MINKHSSTTYIIFKTLKKGLTQKCILLIGMLFITVSWAMAQETVVVGQVLSATDKSPVPFANVFFKYTQKGVRCNEEGYFLLRNQGIETTLVFSSVGYKKQERRIKPGQSVGMEVVLEEDNTLLQDVLILPGTNPAIDLMKRVRLLRSVNDLSRQNNYSTQSTEQNLVLLNKVGQRSVGKRIYDQLRTGNLSHSDSLLVLPLYMAESQYQIVKSEKKQLSKNIYSSPEVGERLVAQLVGEMDVNLNFYESVITVFGKSMISPLSNVGNAYYDYYLADSLRTTSGKQYEIHFRTKNNKNLAFDGRLWIDSTTLALTRIEAELPKQANINFIHNLRISQNFVQLQSRRWTRQSEEMALNMNYELLADSLHPKPQLFVKRSAVYQSADTIAFHSQNFAKTSYSEESLNDKLRDLNNTPILRTAKFVVTTALTGYIPFGKIDIGRIQQIMRVTDVEGFRMNVPFRTNEKLWKNVSVGGYAGYGFRNEQVKYSGFAQFKLPGRLRRIFSLNYTDDFRRIDYNYNDYMYRENPLSTGDEDIMSSILSLKSTFKLSERKEFSASFSNDWNSDFESSLYVRSNRIFASAALPMQSGTANYNSLLQQSVTLSSRLSFGEKTYEDNMQRIYIANTLPVLYSFIEFGKYKMGAVSGTYGKISGSIKQSVRLNIGTFNYIADAGVVIGNVPYPLLEFPPGCESGGYGFYQFNKMNFMEYAADRYLNIHTELILNGLILNQIPLVKHLNLREFFSFNTAYGSLNQGHRTVIEFPGFMNPLANPYQELGVGVTNIFRVLTLQSVWRISGLHREVDGWGLRGCLTLNF